LPEDGEKIRWVKQDEPYNLTTVNARTLEKWLGYLQTSRIEKQWKSLTGH